MLNDYIFKLKVIVYIKDSWTLKPAFFENTFANLLYSNNEGDSRNIIESAN